MAFDINERDATGQNILYVSSLLGNKKLIDVILKFKVKANRILKNVRSMLFKNLVKYNTYVPFRKKK